MTAYHLLGPALFQGTYHLTGPIHFQHGCGTARDTLWVFAAAGRAASRNTHYPAIGLGYAAAGPCTQMYFQEAAAVNLCCAASGYAGVQMVHPAKAVLEDGITPLEAQFNVEVAYASAGMATDRANELVLQLLDRYEDRIDRAPQGNRYQECFVPSTGKPSDDYRRLYDEVREELTRMGLPL
jgi:methylamine--corrinoid protein Co-methyltransferase